jgi:hypothetical protein
MSIFGNHNSGDHVNRFIVIYDAVPPGVEGLDEVLCTVTK